VLRNGFAGLPQPHEPMKPNRKTISSALNQLRFVVEKSPDPALRRTAQAMETAIRWATEETVGWKRPHKEAVELAKLVRDEVLDEFTGVKRRTA
jgi:hypothetical protein